MYMCMHKLNKINPYMQRACSRKLLQHQLVVARSVAALQFILLVGTYFRLLSESVSNILKFEHNQRSYSKVLVCPS